MAVDDRARHSVPAPEPDLTPQEMVARAAAMRQMIRDQQEDAEQRGFYSETVHKAFREAGFYRTVQPRRFGGYEFDITTLFRIVIEIARGDPSTGWCLCLGSAHALPVAAHFTEEGQIDLFGPDGDFRAPHRAGSTGTAEQVDGGYVVNGRWEYSSGIPYATWFLGTARVPNADPSMMTMGAGGLAANVIVAVPRGEYTMLDDWGDILGMRGSGSNTVEIDNVFVPSHHAVPANWMDLDRSQGTIGTRLHGNPMYLGRTTSFYHGELVAITVGAARAALDEFEEIITTRKTLRAPIVFRYENHDYQQTYGIAQGMIDAAETLLLAAADKHMEYCRLWAAEGRAFSMEDDLRLYGMIQFAGRTAAEAVELLFRTGGSSAAKNGQRLQRYFRDVQMYRGHNSAQYMETAHGIARVHFGLPYLGVQTGLG